MLHQNQCKTGKAHNQDAEGGYVLILVLIALVFVVVAGTIVLVVGVVSVFAPVIIGWIIIGTIAGIVGELPKVKGASIVIIVIGILLTIAYFAGSGWKHAFNCGLNTCTGIVYKHDKYPKNYGNSRAQQEFENRVAATEREGDKLDPKIIQEIARRKKEGRYTYKCGDCNNNCSNCTHCGGDDIKKVLFREATRMRRLARNEDEHTRARYQIALNHFKKARDCTENVGFRDSIEAYILDCKIKLGTDRLPVSGM